MYPLMIYRGGAVLTDWRIVNDEAEEAAASGFARLDWAKVKGTGAAPPDEPVAEPVQAPEPVAEPEPVKRGPGRPRKAP
jgi:hypothetical protein